MKSFLQSREWEGFQRAIGRRTWRAQNTLFILHELPYGFSYLYCPRPDTAGLSREDIKNIFHEALTIARNEGCVFIKVDPATPIPFGDLGVCVYQARPLQPRQSIRVDLRLAEKDLLSAMHPKTRYNIKVAEKRGVSVAVYEDLNEKKKREDDFWDLLRETARRDGFSTHERSYYTELLKTNSDAFENILFLAYVHDRPAAGAVVNIFGGIAVYLHGASSNRHRNTMASYLLHWRVMEEMKQRGCATYDLWGIDPIRWPGMTRFKKGFGGKEILYPESADIAMRPFWYMLYQLKKNFL